MKGSLFIHYRQHEVLAKGIKKGKWTNGSRAQQNHEATCSKCKPDKAGTH